MRHMEDSDGSTQTLSLLLRRKRLDSAMQGWNILPIVNFAFIFPVSMPDLLMLYTWVFHT